MVFQKISSFYQYLGHGEVEGGVDDTVQIIEQAVRTQVAFLSRGLIPDAKIDYIKVYEVQRSQALFVPF